MARRPRDRNTPDLFTGNFDPPPPVQRFERERIKAATLRQRIARAVSETLKDCGCDREVVAHLMSEYLGETVPSSMLQAYAAPSRDSHNIPAHRLIALAVVTNDERLLNALFADTQFIALHQSYEALVRLYQLREARDRIDWEIDKAADEWKKS